MSVILDETIRGIWYCPTIPGMQDFLLSLNQLAEGHYKITYRFREYHSDDPFDTEDEKRWFSSENEDVTDEQALIDDISNKVMAGLRDMCGNDFVALVRGDRTFQEFMDEFMEQDFVHKQDLH